MLIIQTAQSDEEFEAAAQLCWEFGQQDAAMSLSIGLDPNLVIELFHNHSAASLAETFRKDDAEFLLAFWNGAAAGCIAFDAYDRETAELHHFFVTHAARENGIGRALLRDVLARIDRGANRRVLLHTTPHMLRAVELYRTFGFQPCPPFRDTPEWVRHTDLFMDRHRL